MDKPDRIQAARKHANLSRAEFGAAMKPRVTFEGVRKWEVGKSTPRAFRYSQMEAVTGVRAAWIESGVGPMLVSTDQRPSVQEAVDIIKRMTLTQRLQVIAEAAQIPAEEPAEPPPPSKPARRR